MHAHIDKSHLPKKYAGTATWELPSGKLLGDFFNYYSSDFESKSNYTLVVVLLLLKINNNNNNLHIFQGPTAMVMNTTHKEAHLKFPFGFTVLL